MKFEIKRRKYYFLKKLKGNYLVAASYVQTMGVIDTESVELAAQQVNLKHLIVPVILEPEQEVALESLVFFTEGIKIIFENDHLEIELPSEVRLRDGRAIYGYEIVQIKTEE